VHTLMTHPVFAFGIPHGSEWLIIFFLIFLVGPVSFALWIAALVSCVKNESSTDNTKVIWVLVIALFHFVGALLYFLIRRPQRIRELGH
jgi:TRAP-type C4-dicarboxylate transport system permease small subunit